METAKARSGFWKALAVVVVLYVIATAMMLSDLYWKVGDMDHDLVHIKEAQTAHGAVQACGVR